MFLSILTVSFISLNYLTAKNQFNEEFCKIKLPNDANLTMKASSGRPTFKSPVLTTPVTVNGTISTNEWTDASLINAYFIYYDEIHKAEFYIKNNSTHLMIAIRVLDEDYDDWDRFNIYFDVDNSSTRNDGDVRGNVMLQFPDSVTEYNWSDSKMDWESNNLNWIGEVGYVGISGIGNYTLELIISLTSIGLTAGESIGISIEYFDWDAFMHENAFFYPSSNFNEFAYVQTNAPSKGESTLPNIINLSHDPNLSTENNDVKITATVNDTDSGINTVMLIVREQNWLGWSIDSTKIKMSNVTENTYEATITKKDTDVKVQYKILTIDNHGNGNVSAVQEYVVQSTAQDSFWETIIIIIIVIGIAASIGVALFLVKRYKSK